MQIETNNFKSKFYMTESIEQIFSESYDERFSIFGYLFTLRLLESCVAMKSISESKI